MSKAQELAKQAGLRNLSGIERFAELVRADERARLLAVAVEPVGDGYTQQFRTGDTPSLAEIKRVVVLTVPVYTADQVAGAVLREREACAKECDEYRLIGNGDERYAAEMCAAAIRARGEG